MDKQITYELNEDMAQAIRKVLQNIKTCEFTQKYHLTSVQCELIEEYFDSVDIQDEDTL